jgi:hypothetical protein
MSAALAHAPAERLVRVSLEQPRLYVACCGRCGTAPGSVLARICTEASCPLADRRHHAEQGA